MKNPNIVTRFAPSPTGYLHIGGLRTALFNYLYARQNGGKFLLRIEDTDMARNSKEAALAILESFKWVGLDYDNADNVVYQSNRMDIYKKYIDILLKEEKAYYCYMSKEELEELRERQKQLGQTPRYDNRYRDFKGEPPSGVSPVVRIKAPLSGEICFSDGVKGDIKVQAKEIDDFIIARSDGSPTYNFVVTIDDALMGVSDVIRGDDHLSNTPKQIIIYNALNFKIPNFFHVPMILNPSGHKLSKRDGAMGVMDYAKMGYLPEALLNFLVRLGWSYGDEEIFSLKDMLEKFSPKDLNSSPSAYNAEKLLWLNAHYLHHYPNDKLLAYLADISPLESLEIYNSLPKSSQELLLEQSKERAKTLLELKEIIDTTLQTPTTRDAKMQKKACGVENLKLLERFLPILEEECHNVKEWEGKLHDFATKEEVKPSALFMPLRFAILGKPGGIGISELLAILPTKEIKKRIRSVLEIQN